MKGTRRIIFGILFLTASVALAHRIYIYEKYKSESAPESSNYLELSGNGLTKDQESATVETENSESDEQPKTKPRPATELRTALNIEVPFFSQAPYANWDYPWQEACEEASLLNVVNLFQSKNYNLDSFNTEELRLVEWEKAYFGDYKHTSVAQTAEMAELQYDLNTEIHENPSFTDIQEILSEGHLIIAPFAGKLLGNPNFRNGGPNYHMLVIKGYDSEKMQIVTNDVGTRNGSNYVYDWAVIENALHDWHESDITLGAKKIIEVFPS